jgi:hypothetical protein
MANSIRVTAENVDLFEGVLAAFKSDLEKLVQLTKKYPVEIEFGDYRFVFSSRSELVAVIKILEAGVRDYRMAVVVGLKPTTTREWRIPGTHPLTCREK